MKRFAIIEAPSVLGLRPTGVERLPEELLRVGLAEALSARHAARVVPPAYDERRDPETKLLNPRAIARYSTALADATGDVLARGELPVVLGGDCSIVLGTMLALRRRGRFGLLFIDGHTDYYQPEANINGEAASSDLALVTGRGPALLTELEGLRPLVDPRDVVAFGRRDREEAAHYGSDEPLPELLVLDLASIRRLSVERAIHAALDRLVRDELSGFWVHVDADVLDDELLPAVDYRMPGGLSWRELEVTLSAAASTGHMVGLELTILNPTLDVEERGARALVQTVVSALQPRASTARLDFPPPLNAP
ncbi:arginase family protein [Pyxidicoccus sp. 3LG]